MPTWSARMAARPSSDMVFPRDEVSFHDGRLALKVTGHARDYDFSGSFQPVPGARAYIGEKTEGGNPIIAAEPDSCRWTLRDHHGGLCFYADSAGPAARVPPARGWRDPQRGDKLADIVLSQVPCHREDADEADYREAATLYSADPDSEEEEEEEMQPFVQNLHARRPLDTKYLILYLEQFLDKINHALGENEEFEEALEKVRKQRDLELSQKKASTTRLRSRSPRRP